MAVNVGLTPAQERALGRLCGKPFTHPEVMILGHLWSRVANAGETSLLTNLEVARQYYDNHRERFWRAVRMDAHAMSLFQACGCTFPPDDRSTPLIKLPAGYLTLQGKDEIRLNIDHIEEKQTCPARALNPSNLRITTGRENQQSLRLLNQHFRSLRTNGWVEVSPERLRVLNQRGRSRQS